MQSGSGDFVKTGTRMNVLYHKTPRVAITSGVGLCRRVDALNGTSFYNRPILSGSGLSSEASSHRQIGCPQRFKNNYNQILI